MALETTFHLLAARLRALLDALTGLHTTVVDDRPLEGDVVLVDLFGNCAEDLAGWTMGALAAVEEAQQALRGGNAEGTRRALAGCHEQIDHVAQSLLGDLLRYERIAELARFGRSRGGEWRAWTYGVKQALDSCLQPLFDVEQAQFACWMELSERAIGQSISIQTTGVGHQLVGAPSSRQ